MKRLIISLACVLIITFCFASEIKKITLAELQSKADLIVLAEVFELVCEGDQDHVTIQIDSFLKGFSEQSIFTFTLVSRGGLKDFDPALKIGDTGVFFLKLKDLGVEKAYWGSVAVFDKNNYTLSVFTDLKYHEFLEIWKKFRIRNNQIKNPEDYDLGFQNGFTSPPGLVDNSADFNLGHSDGMQAKFGKKPE